MKTKHLSSYRHQATELELKSLKLRIWILETQFKFLAVLFFLIIGL